MDDFDTPTVDAAEVADLPEERGFEVVDGELVEKHMGAEASVVNVRLTLVLGRFLETSPLGWLLGPEGAYQCFPSRPRLARKPDLSIVRYGRLPDERIPKGNIHLPPDLAVEVVSPNDLHTEVDGKVGEYLEVGVSLVWVVNPETRSATVYRPDGTARRLREDQELDGETVLPGFRCLIRDLFPPTPATPARAVPCFRKSKREMAGPRAAGPTPKELGKHGTALPRLPLNNRR